MDEKKKGREKKRKNREGFKKDEEGWMKRRKEGKRNLIIRKNLQKTRKYE